MPVAGYSAAVFCATGPAATFSEMVGIKDLQIGDSRDLLDVTSFAGINIRARLAALRDIQVDISGDFEPADAGYLKYRASYDAGAAVYVKLFTSAVAPTSAFGYIFQIGNIDVNSTVDGKAEVSSTMMIDSSSGTATFAL